MRIQLASDLHLESLQSAFPRERLIAPAWDADVLVLAGDIACGLQAIELFGDWPVPVLYVAGNHEFYGFDFLTVRKDLLDAARGTSVRFLDRDGRLRRGSIFGCYALDRLPAMSGCAASSLYGESWTRHTRPFKDSPRARMVLTSRRADRTPDVALLAGARAFQPL
jgi:hypothetical protein